jgi:coproporphyrinogen III oxidase-like Fe-S oxidoreductase
MMSERFLSKAVQAMNGHYLNIRPYQENTVPPPSHRDQEPYMLYAHIPFCESLCPYCSFNRFPFEEKQARSYFAALRSEMRMLAELGYDFDSMYIGGGTPTVLPDELAETIRLAKQLFSIRDVSTETNPNHLDPEHLDPITGLVDRMSVGIQSFDDNILKQMCRYKKYGSASEIFERIKEVSGSSRFLTLNADMIFNLPSQTPEILYRDLERIKDCGCSQATFYPLMASPSVSQSLKNTIGQVRYDNEQKYYDIICRELTEGKDAPFEFGSAWTFNRRGGSPDLIDEYVVDHEEYLAVGAGGMGFSDRHLYINTFHPGTYQERIDSRQMSVYGSVRFNRTDHMRYRLMMQLFGLKLDKEKWKRDFGVSVAAGLPAEYCFLKSVGAFRENEKEITLTPKGRYLTVVMMRQFFIGVNSVRDKARENAGIELVTEKNDG